MKKHMPGFVPVNYKQSGIFILAIGIACLFAKLFSYLTDWYILPNYYVYLGAGLIMLSLYLIFVVPKE